MTMSNKIAMVLAAAALMVGGTATAALACGGQKPAPAKRITPDEPALVSIPLRLDGDSATGAD